MDYIAIGEEETDLTPLQLLFKDLPHPNVTAVSLILGHQVIFLQ